MKKKSFSLFKSIEHFNPYIIHSHTIDFVPLASIKVMLSQTMPSGKWALWLEKNQDFDVDIKPIRIVKRKGLCKIIV